MKRTIPIAIAATSMILTVAACSRKDEASADSTGTAMMTDTSAGAAGAASGTSATASPTMSDTTAATGTATGADTTKGRTTGDTTTRK